METSTTTGTGAYSLAGAVTGYEPLGTFLANGDTAYFGAIGVDANGVRNGAGWEEFYGTYATGAPNTLTRTKIEKSSNANAAVNWAAGTRRIFLIDLPARSKGLNSYSACGIQLPNPKFVRVQGVNLGLGTNDLYTVPAGRRALVSQFFTAYNNSAGTIVMFLKIKVGATYYRVSGDTSITTANHSTPSASIILEPGDILSVDVATTAGLNVFCDVVEYDSVLPLYSPRILNPASGDQTLYTCPAGKTARLVNSQFVPTNVPTVFFMGPSAGSLNWYVNLVPSGGTPGTGNKAVQTQSAGTNTRSAPSVGIALGPGDFININASGTGSPICWTPAVLEILA